MKGSSPQNYKKHSLYGYEDRVVIDPGSRIWKIGFSGEPQPRKVVWAVSPTQDDPEEDEMWDVDINRMIDRFRQRDNHIPLQSTEHDEDLKVESVEEVEVRRLLKARLTRALRDAFIKCVVNDRRPAIIC
jgi:actin-related protein